jgi:hypothetical protein
MQECVAEIVVFSLEIPFWSFAELLALSPVVRLLQLFLHTQRREAQNDGPEA